MKKFAKEFKEFISRGDVMSMAVGIIIGGAFTAIVSSLVNDIISPIIGMILGGVDFSSLSVTVGEASLGFGSFIQAIINFLMTALVLFWIMKSFNAAKKLGEKKKEEEAAAAPAPAPAPDVVLLTEIRDLLKQDK